MQRPRPPPPSEPEGGRSHTSLEATAQLLTFAPGLYAVDFVAPQSGRTDAGLRLPCARLDAVPAGIVNGGRCFVSIMAEGGWLSQSDQPTFIRAVGATAGVMLTVYKAAGTMAAPELRIRRIQPDAPGAVLPPAENRGPADVSVASDAASLPLRQMVHVQGVGDIQALAREWAGRPGAGRQIEGFSVAPEGDLGSDDIEYQAILGEQWNTPWARGGTFCGSRGMALPVLGIRIRMVGPAAAKYQCRYWASFAEKGIVGPVHDGDACEADRAVMEALRVIIVPRRLGSAVLADPALDPPVPAVAETVRRREKPQTTKPVRRKPRRSPGADPA